MVIMMLSTIIETLRRVLLLPLSIILMMTSSAASRHGLIRYTIARVCYLMTRMHVLRRGAWTI